MKQSVLEAADIVMNARAEIRRIVTGARRELLGLAMQVQTIRDLEGDSATDADAFVTRLLQTRQGVRDVLEEQRPRSPPSRRGGHRGPTSDRSHHRAASSGTRRFACCCVDDDRRASSGIGLLRSGVRL